MVTRGRGVSGVKVSVFDVVFGDVLRQPGLKPASSQEKVVGHPRAWVDDFLPSALPGREMRPRESMEFAKGMDHFPIQNLEQSCWNRPPLSGCSAQGQWMSLASRNLANGKGTSASFSCRVASWRECENGMAKPAKEKSEFFHNRYGNRRQNEARATWTETCKEGETGVLWRGRIISRTGG